MPDSRGLEPEIAPRSSVFDGARRHALSSHCSWQFFTMSVIESAKLDAISLILTICGRFFVVARALSCFRLWGCLVRQPRSPLGRVCTSRSKSVRNSRCTAASSISSTFRYCPACAYLTALCVSAGGLDSRASRVDDRCALSICFLLRWQSGHTNALYGAKLSKQNCYSGGFQPPYVFGSSVAADAVSRCMPSCRTPSELVVHSFVIGSRSSSSTKPTCSCDYFVEFVGFRSLFGNTC